MINHKEALEYEISSSSWWASWVSNPYLQTLLVRYFVWKVNSKMGRAINNEEIRKILNRGPLIQKKKEKE